MLLSDSSIVHSLLLILSTYCEFSTSTLTSNVIHTSTTETITAKHRTAPQTRASLIQPTVTSISGRFANQTGLRAANACWLQWDAYSSSSTNCPKTTSLVTSYRATYTETSVIDETYKLCDGHPRANVTGSEWVSRFTVSEDGTLSTIPETMPPSGIPISTGTTTVTAEVTYLTTKCATPVPTPKCSINGEKCLALFSEWTAGNFSRLRPPCTGKIPSDPCDDCGLYIPSVRLMYFPVTMTGNFCGNNCASITISRIADSMLNTIQIPQ